jgi:squalene-hopene/tetraprenyl-beta-curcumene cyclase
MTNGTQFPFQIEPSPLSPPGTRKYARRDRKGSCGRPPIPTWDFLGHALARGIERFLSLQDRKGYWVFDLEADTTIPSEYIFLQRFRGRSLDPDLQGRLVNYIRRRQLPGGGWPLYEGGTADISASVKAYFALKLCGEPSNAHHMVKARDLILKMGGAARVNVFTRITLSLFGQIHWRTAPAMPVEIVLLPRSFFFHLDKVSYWSRTVMVPLLILYAKRPVCALTPEEGIRELFLEQPETLRHLDHFVKDNWRKNFFILIDRLLKRTEPLFPRRSREKAIRQAERWTRERMGEGGIGAIFPAMANAVMALQVLGCSEDDPDLNRGVKALDDLLLHHGDESYCQPCASPIWDTCLSLSANLEAGLAVEEEAVNSAVRWLFNQQIFTGGDWANRARGLMPGGWAFQFENTFYPDVDDTPMVLMSLLRAGALQKEEYRERIAKGVNWILGMQSSDGGWGAFDIDNNYLYLNHIPFADHGALLDPSTSDVTARCVELLSMLGYPPDFPPIARALDFLKREQEASGAWFGRWGVNYIYGTWSVLVALRQVGEDMSQPFIQRAVAWLKACQNPDGGWGESCYTYNEPSLAGKAPSTPSQTAWALLGLMAAGEVDSPAVQNGIHYLVSSQNALGGWEEKQFTGTGFPKVFYLRYHGYGQYFPLWALGVYRRLTTTGQTLQDEIKRPAPPDFPLPALNRNER